MGSNVGFCDQCSRAFHRKRASKTTCSDACRKQKSRGVDPKPYWRVEDGVQKYEDFAAVIYQQRPAALTRLQQIRDRYGQQAMFAAMDVLYIALKGEGIDA